MSRVNVHFPSRLGATKAQVFDPSGAPLGARALVLPGGALSFDAADVGTFSVKVEPIGRTALVFEIEVAADDEEDVDLVRVTTDPLDEPTPADLLSRLVPLGGNEIEDPDAGGALEAFEAAPAERAPVASSRAVAPRFETIRLEEKRLDVRWEAPQTMEQETAADTRGGRRVGAVPPAKRLAIGLAHDTTPSAYGGWRPYHGKLEMRARHAENVWLLAIQGSRAVGQDSGLDRECRLRLQINLEKQRIQRVLLPVFAEGTRFSVQTRSSDMHLSIEPAGDRDLAVVQALAASSKEDAASIMEATAIDRVDGLEPLTSVAVSLAARRHGWFEPKMHHAVGLAEGCRWLADASVLEAAQVLETKGGVALSIAHLRHALDVCACYFQESNAILGDLLVMLAEDAPGDEQRRSASKELARWRALLTFQTRIGPFFSWITRKGYRTTGRIDSRYNRILMSATVDMPDAPRPLPRSRYSDDRRLLPP